MDDRIAEARVPNRDVIIKLRNALQLHEKRVDVYRQIRHRCYAHRPLKETHLICDLFQKTNRRELGETLGVLCELKAAIWDLYHNGKEPS